MRVALIRPVGGFGDSIMITVAIRQFRAQHPEANINVFAPYPYAQVFEHNPDIEEVWSINNDYDAGTMRSDGNSAIRSFAWSEYDVVFEMLGPEIRNERVSLPSIRKHRVDAWCEAMGIAHNGTQPVYVVTETERAMARWYWRKHGLPNPVSTPIVFMQTASANPKKDVPLPKLRALQHHMAKHGVFTCLIGKASHAMWRSDTAASLQAASFRETASLMAEFASVHIGPDSGYHHLAAALRIPQLALYGPTDAWLKDGKPASSLFRHTEYPTCMVYQPSAITGCACWYQNADCESLGPVAKGHPKCMADMDMDVIHDWVIEVLS